MIRADFAWSFVSMQPLAHYLCSSHGNNDLIAPCYLGQSARVIFSLLKLGHRFHALSNVCSDRDDINPFL